MTVHNHNILASPFDKVIDSACRTNPTWTICQTTATKEKLKDDVIPGSTNDPISSSTEAIDITKDTNVETELLSINETTTFTSFDMAAEEPKNLSPEISPKDMVFQAASFLKNESLVENASKTAAGNDLETLKEHYCHTYISNFTNYCHGKERFRLPEVLQSRLTAFCDSFKSTCYPVSQNSDGTHGNPC